MASLKASMLPFLLGLLFSFSWLTSAHPREDFPKCLSLHFEDSAAMSNVFYTPHNSSYSSVLQFSIRNLRFSSSERKPLAIVTPTNASHIQAAILCSRLTIRIRSGGHDFEGLSYRAALPFVIIDLINLRTINVDAENKTAWVQAGATLGELYYSISEKSRTLAFPAGNCPTVGVGGHFSGGGHGTIVRKYGLASDNVIDAQLIDAKGRILDRASMGEDLFWAIRGGGGQSFGVVVAWKIRLVEVPSTVTMFSVSKTLEQNATKLLIADQLLPVMQESFPELGLVKDDCFEMSWIESVFYIGGFPSNASLDVLLNRTPLSLPKFKAKSDYVKEPMPEIAFQGIWDRFFEEHIELSTLILIPYGGKMEEISESSTPFPHRAGNLEESKEASDRHMAWIRSLYSYLTPYVSKNPREAYVNYRDLDLGINNLITGSTSFEQASIWGRKYFKNNFDRLVRVKTEVDPTNFFTNEQSIPSLSSCIVLVAPHRESAASRRPSPRGGGFMYRRDYLYFVKRESPPSITVTRKPKTDLDLDRLVAPDGPGQPALGGPLGPPIFGLAGPRSRPSQPTVLHNAEQWHVARGVNIHSQGDLDGSSGYCGVENGGMWWPDGASEAGGLTPLPTAADSAASTEATAGLLVWRGDREVERESSTPREMGVKLVACCQVFEERERRWSTGFGERKRLLTERKSEKAVVGAGGEEDKLTST
uniref:FAD-binding PCMH-type domain-containing protein n=1 Tax=Salix viminalis TaxID=40686 RepID=A0A6N2N415_SALVM